MYVSLLILSFCCCENVPHWPSVYLLCTSCMRRWLVMRCAKQQQQGKAVSWSRRRRSRGVPSRQPCPARGGGAGGVCSSASIATTAGSSSISLPLFPCSLLLLLSWWICDALVPRNFRGICMNKSCFYFILFRLLVTKQRGKMRSCLDFFLPAHDLYVCNHHLIWCYLVVHDVCIDSHKL